MEGLLGHNVRTFKEFTYPFSGADLLIMHSDGLSSRAGLDAYPGLAGKDPALIAGVLHRDFTKNADDATAVAAKAGTYGR